MEEYKEFAEFMDVMRTLRSPNGCPWDREQTHESLRDAAIEEAYELAEAIDNHDIDNIKEELGDLLLHVVFHSLIGEENGEFTISEVAKGISDKMIFRHPHVFKPEEQENMQTSGQVLDKWEELKAQEKHEETIGQSLQRVAKSLPANIRATKVQKKASKCGMDFANYEQALSKVYEELDELESARKEGNPEHIDEEFGDLMFSIINISRFLGLNAEKSLTNAINKFINRFVRVELIATKANMCLTEMSMEQLDELWTKAK